MIPDSWKFWQKDENPSTGLIESFVVECPKHGQYKWSEDQKYCSGCKHEEKIQKVREQYKQAYKEHNSINCQACKNYKSKRICINGIETVFEKQKVSKPRHPNEVFYKYGIPYTGEILKRALENPTEVQHKVKEKDPVCVQCGWVPPVVGGLGIRSTQYDKDAMKYHHDRCEGDDTKCT